MSEEVGHTAVNGSSDELPAQEEADAEQPCMSPDRRHVDALLDVSEEASLEDLEPYKNNCDSGWEEAVKGWARVAPLSCILLAHKRKPKQKEADSSAPSPVDPAFPNTDSVEEHRCEQNSFKKSFSLKQHVGPWSNTTVAALQKEDWSVLQKTTSALLPGGNLEEDGRRRETPLQDRCTKPQRHGHMVPITNITFLPPIDLPHLNPLRVRGQLCSGKKASKEEATEENFFMFGKKREARVDSVLDPHLPAPSTGLAPKYWPCQHKPHLFSAFSVCPHKRYKEPLPSRRDAAHGASFSVGKSLTQALNSGTAAGAPAHMHPCQAL